MQSDRELIEQIRGRNTIVFEILFERYRHVLYKHILRTVRDERAAEGELSRIFAYTTIELEFLKRWHGSFSDQ